MDGSAPQLDLPGFRFHPTEEELLNFYLKNIVLGKKLRFDVIGFLNIYHHEPRDLPGLAEIGEREWYFFVPRDRKQGSGGRPNRTTKLGFWKATGSDRKILNSSEPKRVIGLKKTLVFYEGRAPRGSKTDWVMNEYRLPDSCPSTKDIVLCKIYRKATSMKVLEQRAAMEEEVEMKKTFQSLEYSPPPLTPPMDTNTISFCNQLEDFSAVPMTAGHAVVFKKEEEALVIVEDKKNEAAEDSISNKETSSTTTSTTSTSSSTLQLPPGKENLLELQVPKLTMDWMQDPFWTQLRSPWLDYLTPYANIY